MMLVIDQLYYPAMTNESRVTRSHGLEDPGILFLVANQVPDGGQAYADCMFAIRKGTAELKPAQAGRHHGTTSFSMIWSKVWRLRMKARLPSTLRRTSAASGKEL